MNHKELWHTLSQKQFVKPDPWNFSLATTAAAVGGTQRPATAATRRTSAWEETDVNFLLEDEEAAMLAFDVLFFGERNVKKALELASEAVRMHADGKNRNSLTRWRINAGVACGALSLYKDAENHFRVVLGFAPNIDASRELARIQLLLGENKKASETLVAATEFFPRDPRLFAAIAKLKNSRAAYMDVVRLDPSSREALLALGGLHFHEEPEISLKFFQRILELHGASPDLWNNIALAAVFSNQTDVGIPAFEQALRTSDEIEKSDIWYNVACFATLDGDTEFGRVALTLAVTLNAKNAEALVNLALLELHAGDLNAASNFLNRAVTANPSLFEAHYNAAIVDFRLSRMDKALVHVNAALQLSPNHPQTRTLRSLINEQLTKQ